MKKKTIFITYILGIFLLFSSCGPNQNSNYTDKVSIKDNIAENKKVDTSTTNNRDKNINKSSAKNGNLDLKSIAVNNVQNAKDGILDNIEDKDSDYMEDEKKYIPENVEIRNSGKKKGNPIISWSPSSYHKQHYPTYYYNSDSNFYILKDYDVWRKIEGDIADSKPFLANTVIHIRDGKFQFTDKIFQDPANVHDFELPIRKYSYTVTAKNNYSRFSKHSKAVVGYIVPSNPVVALQDIFKTLQFVDTKTEGLFVSHHDTQTYTNKNKGQGKYIRTYHKSTESPADNGTYTYTFTNFSPYQTICISGDLRAEETSVSSSKLIAVNGTLTVTGIYEATVYFNNTVFVAKSNNLNKPTIAEAKSGNVIITYDNKTNTFYAKCSNIASLFKTDSNIYRSIQNQYPVS